MFGEKMRRRERKRGESEVRRKRKRRGKRGSFISSLLISRRGHETAVVGYSWVGLPYFVFILVLIPLVPSTESYNTQLCYVLVTLCLPAKMVPYSFVCHHWKREGGGRWDREGWAWASLRTGCHARWTASRWL
ncbi:hypothetical protein LY78DRAFT_462348 [Colletotrichum sublineola]|nr:hypothetical protein LY78DRAFT_462348 [Colletotrichum sublineola]